MAYQRIEPVHRTILAFDIEGFGGPQRSNPVRSMMRMGLYGLIREALAHSIGGLDACRLSDLGDGVLVLIEPQVSKNRVVEPFMSDMAVGLKRYNEQTRANAEIRLRAALHAGEIIEDPQGYSGEDLNFAFRLLDCAALREALSRERANLGLVVSEHFYDTIIKQGFEGIDPAAYHRVDVAVKETTAGAWLYLPIPRPEAELPAREPAGAPAGLARQARPVTVQKPVDIRELPPTCLYVSTANLGNYRLYGLRGAAVPLRNHLETALLLGRHAVLHCLDPYRSEETAGLVGEFEEFVRDGSLLLLLSERVKNPRRDYGTYLERRARDYGNSAYGAADAASFRVPDPDRAAGRTIAFLEASPFKLHRGYSSTTALARAFNADLDVDEPILLAERYSNSRISDLSLTLWQILHLARVHPDGTRERLLADDQTLGDLQDRVADLVTHESLSNESLSKQILLGLITDALGIDEHHPFYGVIAARVAVVHLLATIGGLSFLEVTHGRDRRSPYYYGHLLDHLGVLIDCPPRRALGVELVDELRSLQWWRFFANYHLRLMADLQARRSSGDHDPDPQAMFHGSRLITQFDEVRAVMRNAWDA